MTGVANDGPPMPQNRASEGGRFQPGRSGNPGGRPKEEREVLQLARDASPKAVQTLIKLMDNDNPRTAIAAAVAVLDRAFGKPTQPIAGDDERDPLRLGLLSALDLSKLPEAQLRALASIPLPSDQ